MKSVLASGVAYSTEPTLMADTDRVLLVGELKTLRLHVVEAGDGSADTGVVLETTFYSSVHSTTLYLSNFHFESSLKTARGDEGERGWRITRASINVHVLASVPAADDGYRSSSSHNKPVRGTLVCHGVRLGQIHLVKVQPQLAHLGAYLLNRDRALPDGVEGGGVVVIHKVGGVVISFGATGVLNMNCK